MFSYLDSRDKTAVMGKRMKYFTNSGERSLVISYFTLTINTFLDGFTPSHPQYHSDFV